jgi:energy-coupling factor transporter transmembrane protein EcfT
MRITEISDTLSLSLETRGFKMTGNDYSIYKPIKLKLLDLFYVLLIGASIVLLIIFKG